jgi:hypothetical protein
LDICHRIERRGNYRSIETGQRLVKIVPGYIAKATDY